MLKKVLLVGALLGIVVSSLIVANNISIFPDPSSQLAATIAGSTSTYLYAYDSSFPSNMQITVVWNTGKVASSYRIERLKVGERQWRAIGVTSKQYYHDADVQQGVTYYYRIRYTKDYDNDVSNEITTPTVTAKLPTTRGTTAAPSQLQANYDASTKKVTLSWKDNSSQETGFEIQQQLNDGTWTTVASNYPYAYFDTGIVPPPYAAAGRNATTYSLPLASSGHTYTAVTYRVRAINTNLLGQGTSLFSEETQPILKFLTEDEFGVDWGVSTYIADTVADMLRTVCGYDMGEQPREIIAKEINPAFKRTAPVRGVAPAAQEGAEKEDCDDKTFPDQPKDEYVNNLLNTLKMYDKNGDGNVSKSEIRNLTADAIKASAGTGFFKNPLILEAAERFRKLEKYNDPWLKEKKMFNRVVDLYKEFENIFDQLYPDGLSPDDIKKLADDMDKNSDGTVSCEEKKDYLDKNGILPLLDNANGLMNDAVKEGIIKPDPQGSGSGSGSGSR
jgi:Ca2+-binding EF-hand superfamily protein